MLEKNINIRCSETINYSRLQYTVDFIDNHPLKPGSIKIKLNSADHCDIEVAYSYEAADKLFIPIQNQFFGNNTHDANDFFINNYLWKNKYLYSLEKKFKNEQFFIINQQFSFDILETIFFHISRFEEVFATSNQLDEHGRMRSDQQILVKNKLQTNPVVDHLIKSFFEVLGIEIEDVITGFSMTHDIDAIQKFSSTIKLPKSIGRVLLMGLGLNGVYRILKSYFSFILNKEEDPYYVFDTLLLSENIFDKKIIFFVSGGKTRFDLYNKNYKLWLPRIVKKALNKGYSIGFHPSYNAFNNPEMFVEEINQLKLACPAPVEYIRTHFLRMDFNATLKISVQNDLIIDSTLGYPDEIGFRCGTGFSYFLYDFQNESKSLIKELPLIIMDSALLFIKCNDSSDCFKEKLYEFINMNKFNTHITFNFHNSTFDRSLRKRDNVKFIYSELIQRLNARD